MMKKKIEESMLILAYAFLLCLCAALLCSNASAENAVDLANTPGHDGWLDVCTLPDGGLVFAGYTEIPTGDGPDKGRLLCLNTDRTVRWSYTDPDTFTYGAVRALDDGLWQLVCFWENVEPESEDPALIQQDNLLLPVPEL